MEDKELEVHVGSLCSVSLTLTETELNRISEFLTRILVIIEINFKISRNRQYFCDKDLQHDKKNNTHLQQRLNVK